MTKKFFENYCRVYTAVYSIKDALERLFESREFKMQLLSLQTNKTPFWKTLLEHEQRLVDNRVQMKQAMDREQAKKFDEEFTKTYSKQLFDIRLRSAFDAQVNYQRAIRAIVKRREPEGE